MQNDDNIQPKRLTAKVSHLKTCIGHLRNLANLPVTESPLQEGITNAAHKAYLEAHEFDPREILMEDKTYTGTQPLPRSASDLEMQLQDRSVELIEVLRSVLETPQKLESYRTQIASMAITLESLYEAMIPEAPKADDEPSHSPDFTSANWYGTRYTFAKGNQAETIRVLWEAWEAGGHSLSQELIGEKIGSSSDHFRIQKTFRTLRENGYVRHPAWGAMIQQDGKGCYRLGNPKHK